MSFLPNFADHVCLVWSESTSQEDLQGSGKCCRHARQQCAQPYCYHAPAARFVPLKFWQHPQASAQQHHHHRSSDNCSGVSTCSTCSTCSTSSSSSSSRRRGPQQRQWQIINGSCLHFWHPFWEGTITAGSWPCRLRTAKSRDNVPHLRIYLLSFLKSHVSDMPSSLRGERLNASNHPKV